MTKRYAVTRLLLESLAERTIRVKDHVLKCALSFAPDFSRGFVGRHTHSFDKTLAWNIACYILFRTSRQHYISLVLTNKRCTDFLSSRHILHYRYRTPIAGVSGLCADNTLHISHTESQIYYPLAAAERTPCTESAIVSDSGVSFPSSVKIGVSRTALIAPARDMEAATVAFCSGVNNE